MQVLMLLMPADKYGIATEFTKKGKLFAEPVILMGRSDAGKTADVYEPQW